jgi:hypothetical protein
MAAHRSHRTDVRGVLAGELSQLMQVLLDNITAKYVTPATSFDTADFMQLCNFAAVGSDTSPLVWDAAGLLHLQLLKGADTISIPMQARPPRPPGQRGAQPRLGSVNAQLLQSVLQSVKQQCTTAAEAVLQELGELFGSSPLLQACSLLYPLYWAEQRTKDEFCAAYQVLCSHFCEGAILEPPLPPQPAFCQSWHESQCVRVAEAG